MKQILTTITLVLIQSVAFADVHTDANLVLAGYNIYSPVVKKNPNGSPAPAYVMFFGGQANTVDSQKRDAIYRSTSATGTDGWSQISSANDSPVINSDTFNLNSDWLRKKCNLNEESLSVPIWSDDPGKNYCFVGAINDPTVTVHWNSLANAFEWTMFYTMAFCNDTITPPNSCGANPNCCNDQIWSAVSYNDGATWNYHKRVLRNVSWLQPTTPTAIWTGVSWQVYYSHKSLNSVGDVTYDKYLYEMDLNWNRDVTSYSSGAVFAPPEGMAVGNPEVQVFNGWTELFFNSNGLHKVKVPHTGEVSVWTGHPITTLLTVPHQPIENTICDVITPGVNPVSGPTYDLFFATTFWKKHSECGGVSNDLVCCYWRNSSIQRWRFIDE